MIRSSIEAGNFSFVLFICICPIAREQFHPDTSISYAKFTRVDRISFRLTYSLTDLYAST